MTDTNETKLTTGNTAIDALISGFIWEVAPGVPITYSFDSGTVLNRDFGSYEARAWTDSQMELVRIALNEISKVCNVTFAETSSGAGDLNLRFVPDATLAFATGPANPATIWFADDSAYWGGPGEDDYHPMQGSAAYQIVLNQLGTAMGLSRDRAEAISPEVAAAYGLRGNYFANEIAALQALYGRNTDTAGGNTIYTLADTNDRGTFNSTIWDTGGTDWISNAGSTRAACIDLRSTPLIPGSVGGHLSEAAGIMGSYSIADGVVIENAYGGIADDWLIGNDAGNRLDGSYGADTMMGGLGDDIYVVDNYVVDSAGDVVVEREGGGRDTVRSSTSYTLAENVEELVLTGSSSLNGTGNGLANSIAGNVSANKLSGEGGNDTLDGGGGADSLDGGDGDDLLNGGAGIDTLAGGSGNDVYIVDSANDIVVEASGGGVDTVRSSINEYVLTGSGEVENLTLEEGATLIKATGNGLSNLILGNSNANSLFGGAGNDTLDGALGADTLSGGSGNDVYLVGAGDIVIEVSASDGYDTVRSTVDCTLSGNVENLMLLSDASVGVGNSLANELQGNARDNTLRGNAGNDRILAGDGNDLIYGGADADTLYGQRDNDRLFGDDGADLLTGGDGNDYLDGGAGNDNLVGDAGNDTLVGGGGVDYMNGGTGSDTYRFSRGASGVRAAADSITGYGPDDYVDLTSMGLKPSQVTVVKVWSSVTYAYDTRLSCDYDGKPGADFEILFLGVSSIDHILI